MMLGGAAGKESSGTDVGERALGAPSPVAMISVERAEYLLGRSQADRWMTRVSGVRISGSAL